MPWRSLKIYVKELKPFLGRFKGLFNLMILMRNVVLAIAVVAGKMKVIQGVLLEGERIYFPGNCGGILTNIWTQKRCQVSRTSTL